MNIPFIIDKITVEPSEAGEIALMIGCSESDRKKMPTSVRRGNEAATRWKVLKRLTYRLRD
jgi:23S rRNA-/tRNA-specific pseudouridylate synthase